MNTVHDNLMAIKKDIEKIASNCGRDPKTIELIAVSKTKPVTLITEAIDAGQLAFGENYVQEGVEKINYFQKAMPNCPLIWHFIGPLQSNKSKLVAEHFDWMHTIDRFKIAQRLSDQRPANMAKLNVLIQVNISQEATKSGVKPEEVFDLAHQIITLPNLCLRGLMAIPEVEDDFDKQFIIFSKMTALLQQLKIDIPCVDTLSMGMSGDMKAAILAGSTMVRIGTAIFGERKYL
ncbi:MULTISPECIES: YggS family pyridoxal phosphate-dependent enzyme [unclassified Gilliamella]|uniref:YggS family pyridoxal phosphate-dependent enzyme n=1 Tax=unclassified Gilliamella TaxID=2685620 RepID=UPI00226AB850|nr:MULTISPECIES: YggS family pyridoxal phosphate-dependent enzyme [unclassified Gilliamella]MCX8573428.1 YggS family pyridoxal phosphate-dependent enzyme [Gilliamella sp. B3831]MCX8575944.1 YggS family pyridoxal phosphate-dependent enzyme [Gilliamella sp. B3815]MCX8589452.1 YggS family pyridoxal phosphate-dependent enzyme [Gilliamella sp. B3812]MCX8603046.1 YggS family pyridoxal phosphate-dependent enzyme [Gilliamella sp. B3823]MCX8606835.1 YggS family pyridoxal phosphate-dependent enzyme [Gil